MAKPKKRTAAGKKSAKRGKASVKSARKRTAKRAIAKKPKFKKRRVTKRMTEPKETPASAESSSILAKAAIETTVATAIERPTGGVVVIEEHASVRTTSSASSEGEEHVPPRHADVSSDLADIGSDLSGRPEQNVA